MSRKHLPIYRQVFFACWNNSLDLLIKKYWDKHRKEESQMLVAQR
jgi:hypothetical protein